ncbi:stAR-related lipid transfer protein 5 isoform X1 [Panthera tigris]|uniref:stAR-related lipid transfer protein 5 isoform X1 n=1 Tax=Panthera tigris TaxID=9694 RepID=UPI001C6F7555|nr:stAR-related lipid transfer protein 5 isoform X1 [Panthera tigris]
MDPALAAQMGEAVAEKMLQYRQDKSGWKICREANGVSVSWRPSMEFPGNLYRGEGIVNGTPEKVWGCVKPLAGTLRDQWDENVSSFEIIESITDERGILRQESGVEAGRVVTKNKSLLLVLLHNAVYQQNRHPLGRHEAHFPQRFRGLGVGQEVRGWDSQLQREPGRTHLVTFFQTDLSGYLPRSVVDSFFPRSMAGFYANLEKAVKKFYS